MSSNTMTTRRAREAAWLADERKRGADYIDTLVLSEKSIEAIADAFHGKHHIGGTSFFFVAAYARLFALARQAKPDA